MRYVVIVENEEENYFDDYMKIIPCYLYVKLRNLFMDISSIFNIPNTLRYWSKYFTVFQVEWMNATESTNAEWGATQAEWLLTLKRK